MELEALPPLANTSALPKVSPLVLPQALDTYLVLGKHGIKI
jgi:hypothetical protein